MARYNRNDYYWVSRPRRVDGGIKARSIQGDFARNWWARRWIQAMERLTALPRLQRGRSYARSGQVLSIDEIKGGVVARVQGSRQKPYKVEIRVKPLSNQQWDKVLDVLADQALFAAKLLAGEMPSNIEEAFAAADVSLFPLVHDDLTTECSCPDWANPCKHIAATYYILGDRFDEDPFLLFRMRGRDQAQLLEGLRQRRGGEVAPSEEEEEEMVEESLAPLEGQTEHFWQMGVLPQDFSISIQAPAIPMSVLRRLGEPDFANRVSLYNELQPAYESMYQAAMLMAYSDMGGGDNGGE